MFGIFGRKPNESEMFGDEKWQVAQVEYEGNPIIVRFNAGLKPFVGRSDHILKIAFAIPLNAQNPGGLPSADENEALMLVEDKILDAIRSKVSAIQALAITMGTFKEFVFYAKQDVDVKALHEQLMASITSHEVQCMASIEKRWETYTMWANG